MSPALGILDGVSTTGKSISWLNDDADPVRPMLLATVVAGGPVPWEASKFAPRDIWTLDTPLGELLRDVAYGRPQPAVAVPDSSTLAPNIGHVINLKNETMKFDVSQQH